MKRKPVKRIVFVCLLLGLVVFVAALYHRGWEGFYEEGIEALDKREFEKARELLERAYELNPKSADVVFHLAVASANIQTQWGYRGPRQSEANTYFNEALKLDPHYHLALYETGMMFYRRDLTGKARRFFMRSQTPYNPQVDRAHYMTGLCWARGKRYRFAKKEGMEALALRPTELYYHRLLNGIDRKIKDRPKLYYDFFKGHDASIVKRMLDSPSAEAEMIENPQKFVGFLHEAQYSKNPKVVFDTLVPLLKHPDRRIRREATEFFLLQQAKALRPFLTMYDLVTDIDLKWRLLYIFSEKFPEEAVREAKAILDRWENVNNISQGAPVSKKEPTILEILSLQILAKHSPRALSVLSQSESWKPYEKIVALYQE